MPPFIDFSNILFIFVPQFSVLQLHLNVTHMLNLLLCYKDSFAKPENKCTVEFKEQ